MRELMWDFDLTLNDVSAALFVSSRQLQRAFAHTGSLGFRHELANMRVKEAARLLHENPRRSVASVAAAVGYRQSSFFAKTFRQQLGKPPGVWRRQCRERAREASVQQLDWDTFSADALHLAA
jgi:transcriptional regulator GlxA family with amidase domain